MKGGEEGNSFNNKNDYNFVYYLQQTVCCIIIFVMDAFSCFYYALLVFEISGYTYIVHIHKWNGKTRKKKRVIRSIKRPYEILSFAM